MKINRENVTPEILTEMRELLRIAGVDTAVLEDEEVIVRIERLLLAVIEFGQMVQEHIIKPMNVAITNFVQSPIGQQMVQISESPQIQEYLAWERAQRL